MSRESQSWPKPASVRNWGWEDVVAAERSLATAASWTEYASTVHDVDTAGARLLRANRQSLEQAVSANAGAAALTGNDERFLEMFAVVDPSDQQPGRLRTVLAEDINGLIDQHFMGAPTPPDRLLMLAGVPISRDDPYYETWLLNDVA